MDGPNKHREIAVTVDSGSFDIGYACEEVISDVNSSLFTTKCTDHGEIDHYTLSQSLR